MQFREVLSGEEVLRKNATSGYVQKELGNHKCGGKHAASTETWRVVVLLIGDIEPVIQIVQETIAVFPAVLDGAHLLETAAGFISVFHRTD